MIEVTGEVSHILFQKDQFMIGKLKSKSQEFIFKGNILGIHKGDKLAIKGNLVNHPKYGEQVEVNEWEKPIPDSKDEAVKFLSSGLIKGVGRKRARAIVDKLGENAISIINDKGEEALEGIKGIKGKTLEGIVESVKETFEIQEIVAKLSVYGITIELVLKAYKVFEGQTLERVTQNPYILTELEYVGFEKADSIAKRMGIPTISTYRISAGITHTLKTLCYTRGHCFILEDELISSSMQLLNRNQEKFVRHNEVRDNLHLLEERSVIIEGGQVYPNYLHKHETKLARKLSIMKGSRDGEALPSLEKDIKKYQKDNQIILAEKQKEAIRTLMQENILILTGGAGTGKTTIVKAILDIYEKKFPKDDIMLSAPTGRASKKLEEATGKNASTIHRMIGYRQGELPDFYEGNQLKVNLMVVDEFSMVDLTLAYHLIDALPRNTKLLMIGDVDQLPSVGSGNVLSDMIGSGLPTIRLTEIFRQAQESQIVINSHRVNHGMDLLIDNEKDDFYFINQQNSKNIAELIIKSAVRFKELGYDIDDMMILSPMKKGIVGTIELNESIRETLNPASPMRNEIKVGNRFFREGDKVLHTVNNREKKVYNGELGIIKNITKKMEDDKEVDVVICDYQGQIVEYLRNELMEIELGYVLTIHKSQGGESPVVIMPITHDHNIMLARNLYYTGITRAKEKVVLIGQYTAMNQAISNNQVLKRNSQLKERIKLEVEDIEYYKEDKNTVEQRAGHS